MAYDKTTVQALRSKFVHDQLTLEVAALTINIPIDTARRWKREARQEGDDWDSARAASLMSGGGIDSVMTQALTAVVRQTESTIREVENGEKPADEKVKMLASLADSLVKLTASARTIMPKADAMTIEADAIKAFSGLLMRLHPGIGEEVASALEAYANGDR